MTYSLPQFNLSVKVWRPPNAPPAAATSTITGQLYITPRPNFPIQPVSNTVYQPPIYLRVPMGTSLLQGDTVEVAAGDGWYYRVRWIDRMHRGFGNEYLIGLLEQGSNVAPPYAPPGPPPPPLPPVGGPAYYGYASISSVNATVHTLTLNGVAVAAAADRAYLAFMAGKPTGGLATVTCNGAPGTQLRTDAVGPFGLDTGNLYLYEANPGVGAVTWVITYAAAFTAYLNMISVNLANVAGLTVGVQGAVGIGPAQPSVLMSGGQVLAIPCPVLSCLGALQTAGNLFTYTAPFIDVGARVLNTLPACQMSLNLACYSSPPVGALTAIASVPTTACNWGIEVVGKH